MKEEIMDIVLIIGAVGWVGATFAIGLKCWSLSKKLEQALWERDNARRALRQSQLRGSWSPDIAWGEPVKVNHPALRVVE